MDLLRNIWDFFQYQILGMKWLNELIGGCLGIFGIDITRKVGGSIQFFIYDMIKIMILLGILIFIIHSFRFASGTTPNEKQRPPCE